MSVEHRLDDRDALRVLFADDLVLRQLEERLDVLGVLGLRPGRHEVGDQMRHEEDAAEILACLAHAALQIQDGRLRDVARVDQVVRLVDDDEVLACLLGPEHALVVGLQLTRTVGNHSVPQHVHEREHLRLEHLVAQARQIPERERDDELLVEPVDRGMSIEDVAIVMDEVRDRELDVLEPPHPVRTDGIFDRGARVVRVELTTNEM